jgi:RNA recognition motif-containing protein
MSNLPYDPSISMANLQAAALLTSRTLWMGDINEPWMEEKFIAALFSSVGSGVSVKIVRDKNTGEPSGYGFVDFASHEIAERVLHAYNNLPIQGTNKVFKLKWAQYGAGKPTQPAGPTPSEHELQIAQAPVGYDNSLFVAELDPRINDNQLFEAFTSKIPGLTSAKVITDPMNGRSKGFGFVKFATTRDCQRALVEMQGAMIGSRMIRLSPAQPKSEYEFGLPAPVMVPDTQPDLLTENFVDSSGCTLFVHNLDQIYSSEEALRGYFTQFGEVAQIKVLKQHNCAFVRYSARTFADKAIAHINEILKRGEVPVLQWMKVGPTFNLRQQLSVNSSQIPNDVQFEVQEVRKDVFMRPLDVTELNLEYVTLHCDQLLELTPPSNLLL